MSAPDPEKWKLTDEDCYMTTNDPYGYWQGCEPVRAIAYATARRRAIEELKALRDETCTWCCTGEAFDEKFWHHRDTEGDYLALCDAEEIRRRIAAIEAEEA